MILREEEGMRRHHHHSKILNNRLRDLQRTGSRLLGVYCSTHACAGTLWNFIRLSYKNQHSVVDYEQSVLASLSSANASD